MGLIGGVFGLVLLLGIILFGVYVVPFLYHRTTNPVAGPAGGADSLNGVWVGHFTANKPGEMTQLSPDEESAAPDAKPMPVAMEVTFQSQLGWGVPKFKGQVTVCDAAGQRYTGSFHNENLLTAPDLRLLIRTPDNEAYTHLHARLTSGSLRVSWPFKPGNLATGALNKADAAQFDQLCRNLQ